MKAIATYIIIFLLSAMSFAQKVDNQEYMRQGLSQLGLDSVSVHVIPLKYSLSKKVPLGYELKAHLSGANGQYILQLSRGLTRWEEKRIISHELIHVQQYESKSFRVLDAQYVIYNSVKYKLYNGRYNNRPWERDANVEGSRLYRKIKQYFKRKRYGSRKIR